MILGVIPARAGSKGIPNKAMYPLLGKPLIEYTIEAVKKSRLNSWVISTDHPVILGHYPNTLERPAELAQDDTPTYPVIVHAVQEYEDRHNTTVDAVMILQPTSPLRTWRDIDCAIDMYYTEGTHSLVSVYKGVHPMKSYDSRGKPFLEQTPYDKHKHPCYTRNGAIFICSRELLNEGRLFNDKPVLYEMRKSDSTDLDDFEDLLIAEALLRARRD